MRCVATVLVLLVVATTVAHAEYMLVEPAPRREERFFVGPGVLIGTSPRDAWWFGGLMLEGGLRVPGVDLPESFALRVRAFTSINGGTEQSDWDGKFRRFGTGIELRRCSDGGGFCGIGGFDVAYQYLDLTNGSTDRLVGTRSGPVLGPRFGFDTGGDTIRFRLAIEILRHKTHRDPSRWDGSSGLMLSLVFQH